jgi:peptidyl-prolyl cis-trans isomerase D
MTMLDRMRRHKSWLKWSLALVVLAFVLLYIPDFVRGPATGAGLSDAIATVDGSEVTVGEFRLAYARQMDQYRSMYGGQMDERMLRQLGIDQRVLQGLIEEEISLAEARRLGITASDEEVKARILQIPSFQENGQFIGYDRYRQLLQMQNPPIREADFEEQVRRSIAVEKLQAALTNWISVSEADVEAEFRRRNEKVKLAVVAFPADKFREGLQASDEEISRHFESNKEQYRIPEKRKVRYALLDVQSLRDRITVTPQDVQRSYEDNAQQYSTPEQVRASHILLKTDGKNEADVKKRAEDLAAKAKAGADFAALAKEHSEDDTNNTKGGDLDFFGKGQMVPEFDQVAFALQPGQVSDAFKTSFGYHVVKLTEKRPASTRTLAEVSSQIEDQIKWQRAQDQAERTANEIAGQLKSPADLDAVARPRGLVVAESGFFAREEPISGLGVAPAATEQAFTLKEGEVSPVIRTPQGFAFITVTGRQDAYVPKLDEVKARVTEDVLKRKAVEAAQARAVAVAGQLKSAADFTAAAKGAGLEATTTDLINRGAAIGSAGVSPAVDAVAFTQPVGTVSDPITTDNGAVIIKILEKAEPKPEEVTAGKQQTRDQLVSERRGRFYSSYMNKARENLKIEINNRVLASLTAGS